jgi:hypothetical protein
MCVVEFQHLWLLCSTFRPDLLLSKKPCAVVESEVNAEERLDKSESEKI